MHDWLGIGLIATGLALIAAGLVKHRSRRLSPARPGSIRPEFAAMGQIVRPLIFFAVGVFALKLSLFYFVFGGAGLLTALDYAGLMFVLATYCGYLVAATAKPRQAPERRPAEATWAA
ncbi:hypothetical protein [Rhodopila sp.]|uniref:hypothetical protein n=1 Tax=Rhodopila sp. TaxID=2480087 RepID=UPI003D09BC36